MLHFLGAVIFSKDFMQDFAFNIFAVLIILLIAAFCLAPLAALIITVIRCLTVGASVLWAVLAGIACVLDAAFCITFNDKF